MDDQENSNNRLARQHRATQNRLARKRYQPRYIEQSVNPFWVEYFHKLNDIDDVLEEHLGMPLLYAEARFGAQLIYDYVDGPIWRLTKGSHGKAETRAAIQALVHAETVLNEEERLLGGQQITPQHQHFRKNLAGYLQEIPEPGNLIFDIDLFGMERTDLLGMISSFRDLLEQQATQEMRGNGMAFRAALALRAVLEHYSKKPVTCGKYKAEDSTVVSGVYCRCLEEVFDIIGIEADVYSKASWARGRSEQHPLLIQYRQALCSNSTYCAVQPYLFSEVGWVENVTPDQKVINSIAMNDKRLEYLLCYTKCSMEPDSTTMKTKS